MQSSANVLIVDDEPHLTESLKTLLGGHGWTIQTSNRGRDAISRIQKECFDCILLDLVLPDANGFEILESIKKTSPESRVIVVTGYASIDSAVECLKLGAHDYLKKPINHEELLRRIQNNIEIKKLKEERDLINGKLKLSEERYQYLVQNSPEIIYTLDEGGKFTFVNDSVTSLLGYEPAKLVGKHYAEIVHPDDLDKAKNIFNDRRSSLRSMECTEIRLQANTENGSTASGRKSIIVELKAKGIYDREPHQEDKVFRGTYGVAQDITARKTAENELMVQKMHFQQLFENSPEGIAILDDRDRILNVNRGFARLFGYSTQECIGRPINGLIVPERYHEEAKNLSRAVLKNAASQHEETVRRRKDGNEVDVSVLGYPIHFNDAQTGIYAIYSDITARKRSEKTINETLHKLRKAMGGIIHVMTSTVEARDPYTAGHQQRVAELARSIAQEMGLSMEEVDGIRIAGSIHDLGKIKIPAEILSNPRRITEVEFNLIKTHPDVAFSILREIEFSRPVAEIVHQHHEKIDGSGYPQGLKNGEILLEAKILTIADVVEAISSHRPYRPALGIKIALNEISDKKNVLYDSRAVEACLRIFERDKFQFQ